MEWITGEGVDGKVKGQCGETRTLCHVEEGEEEGSPCQEERRKGGGGGGVGRG